MNADDTIRTLKRELDRQRDRLRELLRRREYLEAILEAAPDAIVTLDRNHLIIDWNRGAEKLFEYTEEEVRGMNIDDIITSGRVESEARNFTKEVLSGVSIPPVETVRYRRDGKPVNVLLSGSPIIMDGRVAGVIAVYTDITQRKRLEEELSKRERIESLGTLAGGIAHDFNNLLSGIFGNISLMSKHIPDDSAAAEYLDSIKKTMKQAVGLTHQLLTFAKGSEPVVETVDITGTLTDTVKFNLAGSSVKPTFDIPDDLWMISADSRQIGEVISNLVINAKESMENGGELRVAASNYLHDGRGLPTLDPGKYIKLVFEDQGEGIPEEILDRVFEPFYSSKAKGSGLGLAVVHSIVSKHSGYVNIESAEGRGTDVTIYLPAVEESDRRENGKAEQHGEGDGSRRISVLVMDDEDYIRELLDNMFSAMGHEVDLACNGAQALELYRGGMDSGNRYDAVIMDLTIPGGMGGRETAERILKMDRDAVLIVSSGYSTAPVMADYRSHGFSGVLAKPYTMDELERVISETVEKDRRV